MILSINQTFAQQFPTFDWARVASENYPSIPNVGTSYSSSITIIKKDASGNIYIAGGINKAMKFANQDIYAQDYNGSNFGAYIMKLNSTGETIQWVKTIIYCDISNFEIDADGFIYVVSQGSGGGTMKYGDATIAGGTSYPGVAGDALFLKINATNGNLVWIKNANAPAPARGGANYKFIQTDNTNVYATDVLGQNANNSTTNRGYRVFKITKSAIDNDPDTWLENKGWILDKPWFRANVDPLFENHILDMKLTNNKQSLWLYLKTGDAWIDDFSNAFFDTRDMILVRLDNLNAATPTVGFMKKFTTIICPDDGQLEFDSQGNVLITGSFITQPNRYPQNPNGNANVVFGGVTYEFPMNIHKQFIAKLTPTGGETWIKFFDQQPGYLFRSLTLDANDNMYVAGGAYPARPTIGSFTSINDGVWIMKMKPDGDQVYMWSNEESNSFGGDPILCATGTDGVLVGTGGTQRRLPDAQAYFKVGTKEVFDGGGFVLSNLKHSGTSKPFEELKMLKNINTSADVLSLYSSHPNNFTELGGNLVFFAWGGDDLNKKGYLWKTNGTETGTTILKEVNSNFEAGNAPYKGALVKTPALLYYEGQSKPSSTTVQREIWKSDGTVAGTVRVKAFLGNSYENAGKESMYDILDIEFCNGWVFFTMTDNANNKIDLWKTDGTEAGTIRVFESCQSQIQAYNNQVYFFIAGVPDPNYGTTSFSMRRYSTLTNTGGFVKSLAPTNAANIPRFFGVVNNLMLFAADGTIVVNNNNVNSGMELWKSDGTSTGTVIVKDINLEVSNNFPPGPFSSGKHSITYANKSEYFIGANFNLPNLENRSLIHDNLLYFNADDGVNGKELWKSDGSASGTVLVKDFLPGSSTDIWGTITPNDSDPAYLYPFNGNIYMFGYDGFGNRGLIKTDGSTNGTVLVKGDMLHGSYNIDPYYNSSFGSVEASEKMPYAVLNNRLYFAGKEIYTPVSAPFNEIWSTDGTPEGTKQLKNLTKVSSTNPVNMYAWNGSLYFTMHKYQNVMNFYYPATEAEPWKFTPTPCTNGTAAGPLSDNPTILKSYPVTIKSNGCLGIVKWYSAAAGGSPIFTGDDYTTPLLNTTTDYYLSCTFNNCESQRTKATVTVTIPNCTTLPSPPSSSGTSVVSGNTTTLTAVGCTEQTRWYGQSSGGAILAQTATFTTPILTSATTYYPVCFVLGCESNRTVLDNVTITPSSGQALDFDGIDDAVTVPANVGFNSQSFTMETWIRFDNNTKNQMMIISGDSRWMGFYNLGNAGKAIAFGFVDNSGNQRSTSFNFTPTVGTWYHLAGTFNNNTKEMSFFVNGELQDIQILNYTPNQTNLGINLGYDYYTNVSFFDGRLEEIRYWNIARTETQIGASYNTELSGNENGLVFYYKFDGEATCDIQDCSLNQLHGTRSGATGTNNKPQFFNTSVALTDIACGVSSTCTLLNPCLSSLTISSPNYGTGQDITRQASITNGLITASNQISNTARVTYQSKAILLNQGFIATPSIGGVFKAEIGGCN